MNENKKLDEIDELLGKTSEENRIKFSFDEVETVEGPQIDDLEPAVVEAQPIKDEPEQSQQGVCIVDETSTSVIFEEGPDIAVNELFTAKKTKKPKPAGKVKFKPVHIVLMAILGVITLWCAMFTVDHTLAANGISPLFCIQSAEYDDQSRSYKGLGYKIQFSFDESKHLTQDCVPFWKQGPNDIAHPKAK